MMMIAVAQAWRCLYMNEGETKEEQFNLTHPTLYRDGHQHIHALLHVYTMLD